MEASARGAVGLLSAPVVSAFFFTLLNVNSFAPPAAGVLGFGGAALPARPPLALPSSLAAVSLGPSVGNAGVCGAGIFRFSAEAAAPKLAGVWGGGIPPPACPGKAGVCGAGRLFLSPPAPPKKAGVCGGGKPFWFPESRDAGVCGAAMFFLPVPAPKKAGV